MKPKKLKIKGLNSFVEMQTINFDKLISRGIFGIFGPTGSGKSTILDAITLSLYGNIPRGSGEYINTDLDELYVSYEFETLNDGIRKSYTVERRIKKDKKGKYKTSMVKLVQKYEEDLLVLAEGVREVQKNIEQIIGLTGEDFTRSVVLPQGKFSEFLKLTGKERRDMLERIFGLQSYGEKLYKKLRLVKKNTITKLDKIEGELNCYKGISKEKYDDLKETLNLLIEQEKNLQKEKKQFDENYEKYKNIWELDKELNTYLFEKEKLVNIEKDICLKKQQLDKAERALNIKVFIENFRNTKQIIEDNEKQFNHIVINLNNLKKELEYLECEHVKALNKKDKELPDFIKKEANVLQAFDIHKKIDIIEVDRKMLEEKYIKNKKKSEELKVDLVKIINEINNIQEDLNKKEKKVVEIKISPEYRQNVHKAFVIENKYKELLKRKEDVSNKMDLKSIFINENLQKYEEVTTLLLEKEKLLDELNKERKYLLDNCPGNEENLVILMDEIVKIDQDLKEFMGDFEKNKEIQQEINKLIKIKIHLEDEINNIKLDLKLEEENMDLVSNEILRMNKVNLLSSLIVDIEEGSPCPLCGSVHHPNIVTKLDENIVNEKQHEKEMLQNKIDNLKKHERQLEIDIARICTKEEKFREEIDKLCSVNQYDIEKLKINKNQRQIEFDERKASIALWNNKKEELNKKIEIEQTQKNNIAIEEVKINEIVLNNKKALEELQIEYKKIYNEFESIEKQYMNLKEKLNLENMEQELKEIDIKEKDKEILEESISELRKKLNKLNDDKEKTNDKINIINNDISVVVENGKEKKKLIDEYKKDINDLSDGRDLNEYSRYIRKNIETLKNMELELKQKLNLKKEKFQQISNHKIILKQEKESLNKRVEEEKKLVEENIIKNKFKSEEDVLSSIINKDYMEKIKNEVKYFDDNLNNINNNIIRLEKRLNGEKIDEDFWKDFKIKKEENNSMLYKNIKEIATLESNLKELKKNLEQVNDLIKNKSDIEHKKVLLDELDKLVEGNKFVEFVATGQLKYIAIEASKRLKSITSDRYCILLDPSGNFVIRDNNSGGMIRAISTLSGGETFLASLCLALALSSQIQLKGNAPLEFFFLDEGFGTLDNELLDTVITSLEKLRNEKFSIGIISHVEELKNRVPIKLIVHPAMCGQSGSKIDMEYS